MSDAPPLRAITDFTLVAAAIDTVVAVNYWSEGQPEALDPGVFWSEVADCVARWRKLGDTMRTLADGEPADG